MKVLCCESEAFSNLEEGSCPVKGFWGFFPDLNRGSKDRKCSDSKATSGKFVMLGCVNKTHSTFVPTSYSVTSCRKMWTRQ